MADVFLQTQESPNHSLIRATLHGQTATPPSSIAPAAASPTVPSVPLRSAFLPMRTCGVADELSSSRLRVRPCDHGHGCSGWIMLIGLRPRAQVPSPNDCAPTATPLRLGLVLPLVLLCGVLTPSILAAHLMTTSVLIWSKPVKAVQPEQTPLPSQVRLNPPVLSVVVPWFLAVALTFGGEHNGCCEETCHSRC